MDPGGTGAFRVTNVRGTEVGAWSPDGRKLVFERRGLEVDARSNQTDVFAMNADGTDQHPLTSDGASERPSFSPDGRQIAFIRVVGGQRQLFVMNADGSGATQLTSDPAVAVIGSQRCDRRTGRRSRSPGSHAPRARRTSRRPTRSARMALA